MNKVLFGLMSAALMCSLALFVGCSDVSQPTRSALPQDPGIDAPRNPMSTPTLACGTVTSAAIEIEVCAGATGAPAGFSLQWMTAADFAANGNMWYASDDPRLCKASFSGNANNSRYDLAAGECVTVDIGDILLDNGASTTCNDPLVCDVEYVFRAFAHASNQYQRSAFTANLNCTTMSCEGNPGDCTFTQGYWKTHGPEGCVTGNNSNEWPQDVMDNGLTLCTGEVLTAVEACALLQMNGSAYALVHQQIAAALNVANGASGFDAAWCYDTDALADYNEGLTGPGHCP